jgi:hypothetical protein
MTTMTITVSNPRPCRTVDVNGAITLDAAAGDYSGTAIAIPDAINGGYCVLGDSPDMWLDRPYGLPSDIIRDIARDVAAAAEGGGNLTDEVEAMMRSVSTIADVKWDSERSLGVIVGVAPDSAGDDTAPGSAWHVETDRIIADVRRALHPGWEAEWVDDDIHIVQEGSR